MKTCLVIGGAGFIGRNVVSLLVGSGREVIVLGRRPNAHEKLPRECRYISGDYTDRTLLRRVLENGAEVIDMAYSTVPKTSYDDPVFDLLSNLPASVGLFQEALSSGSNRVLIVSSGGTVYGPTNRLPISENHPTMPISPYGITKLTTDLYASMFHTNTGLPVVVVRPANAYGEEQKTGTGQGFIAAAIEAILCGREIEIYGKEGTIRDYIHVKDVAAGILAVLNQGRDGEIYNIGTGIGTSNAEIVRMLTGFAESRSLPVRVKTQPPRRFDVAANILDCSKLNGICGWKAEIPLESGLRKMWEVFLDSAAGGTV